MKILETLKEIGFAALPVVVALVLYFKAWPWIKSLMNQANTSQ